MCREQNVHGWPLKQRHEMECKITSAHWKRNRELKKTDFFSLAVTTNTNVQNEFGQLWLTSKKKK